MVTSFAEWVFNVMVWGAILAFVVLLYDAFIARGFLAGAATPTNALIGLAVVAVLSALWPKY